MRTRSFAIATAILFGSAACGFFAGIDDLEIGECKGGPCPVATTPPPPVAQVDSSTPPSPDGEAPCPTKPPRSIRIGGESGRFCIDTTEVTRAQYAEFVKAAINPATQPNECAWNLSFAPDEVDGGSQDLPVTGVDWCDARAYCVWAGKYLCGRFEGGRKTGPVPLGSIGDYRMNQWMTACSEEGKRAYSYGGEFDATKCNLLELDAGGAVPAGSLAQCVGGYPGIFDMMGNVWEWYDGPCVADGTLDVDGGDGGPETNNCRIKGGSFLNEGAPMNCAFDAQGIRRDLHAPWLGFRCCAD